MNVDVQQLQKYRSTLKHYGKKMKQIDDTKHKHKNEKYCRDKEINHAYKKKMMLIKKKYDELKINFASARRRIKDISSIISDYGFILNYLDNDNYCPIEIEKDRSPVKENISAMKEILMKKEKRYIAKLKNLKTEKKLLQQKQYELSAKKLQIDKRYEDICEDLKDQNNNTNSSFFEQFSDQYESQIKHSDLMNKSNDSRDLVDSSEFADYNEHEFEQQEDLIIQQLQVQEQQLNELIMKNKIQKEKIESKSSEIRLLKKSYLSNRSNLEIKQNIYPQNIPATNKYDSDQNHYSEESYGEPFEYERYDQLVLKQKQIDEENKSIDLLIAKNNQIRSEIENEYETKLKKITELSDRTSEPDKLIILIHKMNDEIIEAKEKFSQLDLSKKRILRQNENIKNSIEKIKNDKEELRKRAAEANNKKKVLEEQEINLKKRLNQYEKEAKIVDNQNFELNNKKTEVEQLEYQMSCFEEKVEESNEEIKRLSGVVDKLLLSVSSNRADSRMNRLQEMIDSKSDIDVDNENRSDSTFNKFFKNSANSISSP